MFNTSVEKVSTRHARLTLLKKSSPIDRPKKQARLAALHAIGSMRLTILYPQNRVLELCPVTFSTTSISRATHRSYHELCRQVGNQVGNLPPLVKSAWR